MRSLRATITLLLLGASLLVARAAGAQVLDPTVYYRLTTQWQGTGKALDVVNDGGNNDQVWLAPVADASGQLWRFVPAGREGYYRLICAWQPRRSLDVVNDGANNSDLALRDTASVSGQRWRITRVKGGYYRLTTEWQGDGKSLDVVNDGTSNSKLQLAATGNRSGQFWRIEPTDKRVER
jgi:hypothetical protein